MTATDTSVPLCPENRDAFLSACWLADRNEVRLELAVNTYSDERRLAVYRATGSDGKTALVTLTCEFPNGGPSRHLLDCTCAIGRVGLVCMHQGAVLNEVQLHGHLRAAR